MSPFATEILEKIITRSIHLFFCLIIQHLLHFKKKFGNSLGHIAQMIRQRQLGFEILASKNLKHFGGAYLKNSNAKEKRPITTKRCMHLVLRALLAKGKLSFLNKDKVIRNIISKQAKKFGVKVYKIANGGNHLHLIILPRSREAFNSFIRSISGLIAREILGKQRGASARRSNLENAKSHQIQVLQNNSANKTAYGNVQEEESIAKIKFWDKRPFTRIVEWGREYKTLQNYLEQNTLEAWGFIPYQPRKNRFNLIHSTA
jgi:REP element-mobilizing transposase RayT